MAKKDESLLQKQWKEKDVNRIRNLITKKFGDKTTTQLGYTKQEVEHQEGDVWEENGKKYTIENGIKISVSKLDTVKKLFQMPFLCPNCNKPMKKPVLDKKMWSIHKKCFDCVIEYETKLKNEGKFEEYERKLVKNSLPSYIKDLEQAFNEFINESKESFVTEEGDVEDLKGTGNIETLKKEFEEYINKLKNIDV